MKIAIYTCIPDNKYDDLINPKIINPNIDYICFTNNSYHKLIKWKIFNIPKNICNLSSIKINRYIKLFPNKLPELNNYDYTIYVDANTIIINNFQKIIDLISSNKSLYLQTHEKRNSIHEEANRVIETKKDNILNVNKLMNLINNDNYPDNLGLSHNNILIRKNHDDELNLLMEFWWNLINNYSYRDQLSLMYSIWKCNFNNYQFINHNQFDEDILVTKHLLANNK